MSIIELFYKQCESNGKKNVLKSHTKNYSYEDLNYKINKFSSFLKTKGIKKDDIVGVHLERDERLVISLMSLIRLGVTFVPLDMELPKERIKNYLKEANIKATITSKKNIENQIIYEEYEDFKEQEQEQEQDNISYDVVYIIFTSGSTGTPKGVKVSNKNFMNLLYSFKDIIDFNNSDKMLFMTSISFDISLLEIFMPICFGGELHIVDTINRANLIDLQNYIIDNKINVIQATPSVWNHLANFNFKDILNLKLLSGGENISLDLSKKLLNWTENVWNLYGPTETTIWSTAFKLDGKSVFLGKPIANTSVVIIDEHGKALENSGYGELYIGGDGVCNGYLNNDLLKFVTLGNILYYKTGDLVELLDHNIRFLGRKDSQIKINGHRIEVAEIIETIKKHSLVANAHVLNISDTESLLVGYVVVENPEYLDSSIKSLVEQGIRKLLCQYLISIMIPSKFIFLNELPLTISNKVDELKLKKLYLEEKLSEAERVTDINESSPLLELWKKILRHSEINNESDFFQIGGDSLSSAMLCVKIKQSLNIDITIEEVFKYRIFNHMEDLVKSKFI